MGSEASSSEGSSSSAEEGASPREERGSAEEGASPSEDPAPGAEVEGGAPAGPIPGPAAMDPDLGPVLSLSPDGVVCRAQFPHGRIVAYGNTHRIVAECTIAAHGDKCHLTRTLTEGRRAGQGRPLGLLLAWLQDPSIHEASRTTPGWHRPAFAERAACRSDFAWAPGAEEMLSRERAPAHDEGEEPGYVA